MDLIVVQAVARELDELLRGGFVNKIHQPLPREVIVRIRLPRGGEKKLVLSADPKLGRLHLTDLKIPNPPVPPRLCAFLRAHFQGSRILRIEAAPDDRVVNIVATRGRDEERVQRSLVLELLGRDSNIILVDDSTGTVMDCLHRIPEKEAGSRVVMPGTLYHPPPRAGRTSPHTGESATDDSMLPGIAMAPNGKARLTTRAAGSSDRHFASMNEAADAFLSAELQGTMLEAQRRALMAPVKARIRSLQKRVTKIEADEARLRQFEARGEEGELLKSNLRKVRKGMDSIVVQDWLTGQDRTIRLEPALDAVANMQKLFKQAAKGKRGSRMVQERKAQTESEMRALEEQLYFLESAADVQELDALSTEVGTAPAKPARGHRERGNEVRKASSSTIREYKAPSSRTVLVGKSSKGNDYLLRHKADKEDLWFHVKDRPGAHVLLRTGGSAPVPDEDLVFAANLAAHFSAARGKGKVDVMVAAAKDVDRLKGGLPGQVTVKRFRCILAEG